MSIFRELQRRNVLRVAAGYIAVSWLIVQVMDTMSEAFGFTGEHMRIAIIVLAVCFVPVMIISWAFELTPEGLKRESEVEHEAPTAKKSAKRLDRFVMAALAVAVAYFVIDEIFFEKTAPLTEAGRSIAVLPFVNMSSDPEQEYFSDGISEEMLNLLAKIPELRVISRTSAFQYKNTDKEIPEIAQELRVAHVLEGSVRKAGDTIRITAQLIHASTDAHVWSDTWDRELDDIFAIQDEIAAQVVERLRIELVGEPPHVDSVDPEAYLLYLKADHIESVGIPGRGMEFAELEAARLYARALEIEPTYVDAMSRLALAYFRIWRTNGSVRGDPLFDQGTGWLRRALEIDPENALANSYAAWGMELNVFPPIAQTAAMIEQAFNREPTNPEVARTAMLFAGSIGRPEIAAAIGEYVVARDPRHAFMYYTLSLLYREAGMFDKATEAGKVAQALGMNLDFSIANTALYDGDPGPMLALLEDDPEPNQQTLVTLAQALHTAGREAESDEMLALVVADHADQPVDIAMAYAWKGDADAAFKWLEPAIDRDKLWVLSQLRVPLFDPIRSDPRWEEVLRRLQRHPDQLADVKFDPKIPD